MDEEDDRGKKEKEIIIYWWWNFQPRPIQELNQRALPRIWMCVKEGEKNLSHVTIQCTYIRMSLFFVNDKFSALVVYRRQYTVSTADETV